MSYEKPIYHTHVIYRPTLITELGWKALIKCDQVYNAAHRSNCPAKNVKGVSIHVHFLPRDDE